MRRIERSRFRCRQGLVEKPRLFHPNSLGIRVICDYALQIELLPGKMQGRSALGIDSAVTGAESASVSFCALTERDTGETDNAMAQNPVATKTAAEVRFCMKVNCLFP